MVQLERGTTLKSLDDLLKQVGKAEDLLSDGEDIAALQLLIEVKKSIRQVVVILVVQCFQKNLEAIDGEDQLSFELRLRNLVGLMNFVLLALCPDCRQQTGAKLREV